MQHAKKIKKIKKGGKYNPCTDEKKDRKLNNIVLNEQSQLLKSTYLKKCS